MKKKIIYITFTDLNYQASGSAVRPKKIYDTFRKMDYDIQLLTGLQNRMIERWKNVILFYLKIRKEDFNFCYIEPPTGPFFNFCDHLLLLYIYKIKKVSIGLFYRDAYWKFADWYALKGIKKYIINFMHKFDLFIFKKTCKIIYFPTEMMANLFEIENKDTLPPGCDIEVISEVEKKDIELVYVGGISEQYGGPLLLEALREVNKTKSINLHLVCRENKCELIQKYKNEKWLKIYNTSGDGLKEIYNKCNLAIIPRKVDFYMDFAMPVKLMEYISFGLPIVATNCKEVEKFITKNKIGLVCNDNVDSLKNTLLSIDIKQMDIYRENVLICREKNTWESRIEKISQLGKIEK